MDDQLKFLDGSSGAAMESSVSRVKQHLEEDMLITEIGKSSKKADMADDEQKIDSVRKVNKAAICLRKKNIGEKCRNIGPMQPRVDETNIEITDVKQQAEQSGMILKKTNDCKERENGSSVQLSLSAIQKQWKTTVSSPSKQPGDIEKHFGKSGLVKKLQIDEGIPLLETPKKRGLEVVSSPMKKNAKKESQGSASKSVTSLTSQQKNSSDEWTTDDETIDSALERKAKKIRMTAKNVKSLLHYVLSDESVKQMFKDALASEETPADIPTPVTPKKSDSNTASDGNKLDYLPKWTRAKMKDLMEKGNIPLSPAKQQKPGPSILDVDFGEEEDDEEYSPDKDECNETDDESVVSSQVSEFGSPYPRTPGTPVPLRIVEESPVNLSPSVWSQPPKKETSKEGLDPNLQESEGTIALRTRSKLPLTDTSLFDIEEAFVAPDITADLYDTNYDDEEWTNFLYNLHKTNDDSVADDDANDPEFNYIAEAEMEQLDYEDFRFDKPTKISKKELNTLINELQNLFDDDEVLPYQVVTGVSDTWKGEGNSSTSGHDVSGSLSNSMTLATDNFHGQVASSQLSYPRPSSSQTHFVAVPSSTAYPQFKTPQIPPWQEAPSTSSWQEVPSASFGQVVPSTSYWQETPGTSAWQELPNTSSKQQLQSTSSWQEIQSTSSWQGVLSTSPSSSNSEPVSSIVSAYHRDLIKDNLRKHIQLLAQTFLLTHKDPEKTTFASTARTLLTEVGNLRLSSSIGSHSLFNVCNLDPALAAVNTYSVSDSPGAKKRDYQDSKSIIYGNPAFLYPQLLPTFKFPKTRKDRSNYSKNKFLDSENNLIALGLEQFEGCQGVFPEELIHKLLIRGKTANQIYRHIRFLSSSMASINAVKKFRRLKQAVELDPPVIDPVDFRAPQEKDLSSLPAWCREFAKSAKGNTRSQATLPLQSSTPIFPSEGTFLTSSTYSLIQTQAELQTPVVLNSSDQFVICNKPQQTQIVPVINSQSPTAGQNTNCNTLVKQSDISYCEIVPSTSVPESLDSEQTNQKAQVLVKMSGAKENDQIDSPSIIVESLNSPLNEISIPKESTSPGSMTKTLSFFDSPSVFSKVPPPASASTPTDPQRTKLPTVRNLGPEFDKHDNPKKSLYEEHNVASSVDEGNKNTSAHGASLIDPDLILPHSPIKKISQTASSKLKFSEEALSEHASRGAKASEKIEPNAVARSSSRSSGDKGELSDPKTSKEKTKSLTKASPSNVQNVSNIEKPTVRNLGPELDELDNPNQSFYDENNLATTVVDEENKNTSAHGASLLDPSLILPHSPPKKISQAARSRLKLSEEALDHASLGSKASEKAKSHEVARSSSPVSVDEKKLSVQKIDPTKMKRISKAGPGSVYNMPSKTVQLTVIEKPTFQTTKKTSLAGTSDAKSFKEDKTLLSKKEIESQKGKEKEKKSMKTNSIPQSTEKSKTKPIEISQSEEMGNIPVVRTPEKNVFEMIQENISYTKSDQANAGISGIATQKDAMPTSEATSSQAPVSAKSSPTSISLQLESSPVKVAETAMQALADMKTPTKLRPLAPKEPSPVQSPAYVPLPKISPKRKELNRQVRHILPKSFVFEAKNPSPTKATAMVLKKKAICQQRSPVKILPRTASATTGNGHPAPRGPGRVSRRSTRSQQRKTVIEENVAKVKDEPLKEGSETCESEESETSKGGVEKEDQIQLDDLMAASTTIRFATKQASVEDDTKGKTKKQRELALLQPDLVESDPKKDERDIAFAQGYFDQVKEALKNDPDRFRTFLDLLKEMNKNHRSPVELYADMALLLADHQQLVEDFAGFLLSFQALECQCFISSQQIKQIRKFLRQIEIHCGSSTSTFQKVLRALGSWLDMYKEGQENVNIREKITSILRNIPGVLDDLISYFLDGPLPDSQADEFEEVNLEEDMETNDEFENVILPNEQENYNTKTCSCHCHSNTQDEKLLRRRKHCVSCSLKMHDGEPILKTSWSEYHPLSVVYPLEEKEKLVKAKKEAAQIALAKAKAQQQKGKKEKSIQKIQPKTTPTEKLKRKEKRSKGTASKKDGDVDENSDSTVNEKPSDSKGTKIKIRFNKGRAKLVTSSHKDLENTDSSSLSNDQNVSSEPTVNEKTSTASDAQNQSLLPHASGQDLVTDKMPRKSQTTLLNESQSQKSGRGHSKSGSGSVSKRKRQASQNPPSESCPPLKKQALSPTADTTANEQQELIPSSSHTQNVSSQDNEMSTTFDRIIPAPTDVDKTSKPQDCSTGVENETPGNQASSVVKLPSLSENSVDSSGIPEVNEEFDRCILNHMSYEGITEEGVKAVLDLMPMRTAVEIQERAIKLLEMLETMSDATTDLDEDETS